MKNKTFVIALIVVGVSILFGFTVFKLYRLNQETKANLPYLLIGEKINYFDLLAKDAKQISVSAFKSDRPVMIFIFSRPCSPCDKNIVYWKKMAEILQDSVDFYGVVLGNATEAFNFAEEARLNLEVYVPVDLYTFILNQRIKLNFSQTILYARNEVKFLKLGVLEGEEAVNLINMAKKLI
jgi:thiol-disulfide isomerase/thioredoxin